MKKIILVLFLNIIFIAVLILLLESFAYSSIFTTGIFKLPDYNKFEKLKDEFLVDNHLFVNYQTPKDTDPIHFENDGRSYVNNDYKKPSILLLGDSYTYGLGLEKKDSLGYQLSHYTKRPVFNWAWCTEGIEYSFLELKNPKNIEKILQKSKNNPIQYVFYTYSYNQPQRIILPNRQYRYKHLRKYGVLPNQNYSFFENSYIVFALKNRLFVNSLYKNDFETNILNFSKNQFIAINNELKKHFPKAKFVIIIYSDNPEIVKNANLRISNTEINLLNKEKWKSLEQQGIETITTEELIGKTLTNKHILENERTITIHPNGKAWEKIVPQLAKKYNL